jgi:hypothetical protein
MLKKTICLLVSIFFLMIPGGIVYGIVYGIVCGKFSFVDRERLEAIVDDTPLARSEDRPAWDYLFGILRDHSETEIEQAKYDAVGFTELSRQPVEYRGRLVRITGQLLRCEWIPQDQEPKSVTAEPFAPEPFTPEPFDEKPPDKESNGFYESWILVRDKKDIPISVCSLKIPSEIPVGDGLNEQVFVTGFFYKRRLFLSSDSEEVTTPVILAKNLRRAVPSAKTSEPVSTTQMIRNNIFVTLLFLFFLWFGFRVSIRHWKRSNRKPIQIQFSGSPPQNTDSVDNHH